MTQGLLYLFFAFFVSVLLTPFVISIASQHRWLDQPNFRKIHSSPLPRLGGLAVFISLWAAWFLFASRNPMLVSVQTSLALKHLFAASLLVWFLGIFDDLVGANAWQKLLVQLSAAAWVVSQGIQIKLLHNPMGGDLFISSPYAVWVLSILWIVFVTNSINLIDGLDGLAAGVCFITSLSLFFISKELGSPDLPYFSLCISGACLGFLVFNFSPAKIFLGDSGSLTLGFILACLSILGSAKRSTAIVMFGPPLILALPVLDALMAVGRRFCRRLKEGHRFAMDPRSVVIRLREIFRADQEHIHHALLKVGLSHRSAVILLYCVTMVLGVTAYRTATQDHIAGTLIVFAVLSFAIFCLRRVARRRGM